MSLIEATHGDGPLVLGLPHTGTYLPPDLMEKLNARGKQLADTDWHVHRLYEGLAPGISSVRTRVHRYGIDVNRDPFGASLYPGENTTELCPTTDFDGAPIWRAGSAPAPDEVAQRIADWHAPYHAALHTVLERVHAQHGYAILYDCHSIRSEIPYLFEGRLPDLNIGTNNGVKCAPELQEIVVRECASADAYTSVLNGRFKGGWTTRAYGRPGMGYHAIQMELAQSTYLAKEEPPWTFDEERAERLRVRLQRILDALTEWRPA